MSNVLKEPNNQTMQPSCGRSAIKSIINRHNRLMVVVRWTRQMRLLRKPTIIEIVALTAITGILAALILNDLPTSIRRQLERRARNWKHTPPPVLSNQSLIAADSSLVGKWVNRRRLNYTAFTFANRVDGRFNVEFSTSGCLGGCELSRIGTMADGAVVLDGAVAEYVPRIYDTIYAIRVEDVEYLLPAASVPAFERELNAGSDHWKWYVHSRIDESNEPADARKTSAQSNLKPNSTPRSP